MIRGKFRKGMLGIAFVGAAVLAAVLSACNATIPNPNTAVEFKPTGTIQGVLRDAVTNEPIVGAKVDIGVASTTTTADGQFVITNVPATQENTIVGGAAVVLTHGAYRVTVVMAGVTSPAAVCAAGGNAAGTLCYAPFYLLGTVAVNYSQLNEGATATTSTTATNHNTQVTGLVSTVDWKVGKLSGVINGTVANNTTNINVGAGYTVKLVANDSLGTTANLVPAGGDNGTSGTVSTQMGGAGAGNGNMGAGFSGNLVATTTTDASGKFSFKGIEAGRTFLMTATSADGNYATIASYPITAPGDNNPNNWYNNPEATTNAANFTASAQNVGANTTGAVVGGVFANHHALYVAPTDKVGPIILSVSPGNGSDNAPSTPQVVTITFKEAVAQNSYSCGGPSTCTASATGAPTGAAFEVLAPGGTVYNTAAGNTGTAIATLYTDTVVSGATKGGIAKSMFWSADMKTLYISFATGKSMFYTVNFAAPSAQLKDAYGTKITDPDGALVAGATAWTLSFTTNGGNLITAAPSVFVPDLSGLNYTGGGTITWTPVAGAVGYNVYCQEIYIWQDGTGGTPTTPASAQSAATLLINTVGGVSSALPVTTATQAFNNPAAVVQAGIGFNVDKAATSGTGTANLFLLGNVGVQYSCTVKGVNSDRTEGPASTAVVIGDTVAPTVSTVGFAAAFAAAAVPTTPTLQAQAAGPVGTVSVVPVWQYKGALAGAIAANLVTTAPGTTPGITDAQLGTSFTSSTTLSSITQVVVTAPGLGYTATPTQCGQCSDGTFAGAACIGGGNVPGANQFSIVANTAGQPVVPSTCIRATASLGVVSYTLTGIGVAGCTAGQTAAVPSVVTTATAQNPVLDGNTIGSVNMGNGGAGYTNPPAVAIAGTTGTLAAGIAHVSSTGVVDRIYITNAGGVASGGVAYTAADANVAVTFTAAAGSFGAVTGTLSITSGRVTGFNITSGGSGYTPSPTVTISGGAGSGATADAVVSGGAVVGIVLTNKGTGYTTAPTVTISGPSGGSGSATLPAGVATAQNFMITLPVVGAAQGSGYAAVPAVTLGTDLAAVCTAKASLGVVSMTVGTAGAGYTEGATITFNTPAAIANAGLGSVAVPVAAPAGVGAGTSSVATAAPYLSTGASATATAASFAYGSTGDKWELTFPVSFSEPMRLAAINAAATYVIAKNTNAASTDAVPVVTAVTPKSYRNVALTLTVTKTAGSTYSGKWNLSLAGNKDIAGNAITGLGNVTPGLSTPTYYNVLDATATVAGWE